MRKLTPKQRDEIWSKHYEVQGWRYDEKSLKSLSNFWAWLNDVTEPAPHETNANKEEHIGAYSTKRE